MKIYFITLFGLFCSVSCFAKGTTEKDAEKVLVRRTASLTDDPTACGKVNYIYAGKDGTHVVFDGGTSVDIETTMYSKKLGERILSLAQTAIGKDNLLLCVQRGLEAKDADVLVLLKAK